MKARSRANRQAFSLVEVVIALGVIAFAIIAILGAVPAGLNTGHAAQDETRAVQIAQDIFSSLASQSQTKYPNLTIIQPATANSPSFSYNIALDSPHVYDTMAANNDGRLIALKKLSDVMGYPFQVLVQVSDAPAPFDKNVSCQVTVRVISPPSTNTSPPFKGSQSVRDFTRVISKF
jgi:type II secretory pathway pseudopilin PulG